MKMERPAHWHVTWQGVKEGRVEAGRLEWGPCCPGVLMGFYLPRVV